MSDEKIRLFAGLQLPRPVREALVDWRSQAVSGMPGLRLIGPADLHVTLCFLGWQARADADAISSVCAAASAHTGTLDLAIGSAIWLPRRRPRVLAVELAEAEGRLVSLQAALSEGLQARGWYRPEKRRYRAHVTVARVRRGARVRARELIAPPELRFAPAQVTLFRSRLSPSGARYEVVARANLG